MSIEIFNIAQTRVNESEVARWMEYLGANSFSEEFLQDIEADVLSEPAAVIAIAAKRCYMSFEVGLNPNVTRVRKEYVDYFDNILKSGHGSVLEHSTFTFALEGVSRVFTAEMNRHRAGWAISEGSLRFIRFDKDIEYWIPTSIQGDDVIENRTGCLDKTIKDFIQDEVDRGQDSLAVRKHLTRLIFEDVFKHVESRYGQLLDIWDMDSGDKDFTYKKHVTSCLRRIVPMGVATGGVWTGNVRALRHVLAMRASPAAEEEILHVFSRIAEMMVESQPLLFGDFSKVNGYWSPKYPKV
jgi:thymidylate synthase (FAD)